MHPPLPRLAIPPPHRSSTTATPDECMGADYPLLHTYLADQPLPASIYSHDALLASPPNSLPPSTWDNPALRVFLRQGDRRKGDVGRDEQTLTDSLDERERARLRAWLVQGIEAGTTGGSSLASPLAAMSLAPSPLRPALSTTYSAPSVYAPSSSSSSRPSNRSSSISSSSTSLTSSSLTTAAFRNRHIALQLAHGINFSKTWWRATVLRGVTVLTQLPPSNVANGGLGLDEEEEDEEEEMFEEALEQASDEGASDDEEEAETTETEVDRAGTGDETEVPSPIRADSSSDSHPLRPGIPAFMPSYTSLPRRSATDLRSSSPTPSEPKSEPDKFPLSVHLARRKLGRRTTQERVGDFHVSLEGARDATSLEGMAVTLWDAPVGIFRCNRDLSITQANPKWRATCNIAEGETNDAWPSRIHPSDRDRVVTHYLRIASQLPLERDELEFRWLPEGGKDQWCRCVIEPVVIDGRMEGYTGMLLNINKHKAAETASSLREQLLRNELAVLSETTSTGLVKIDLSGHFVSANRSWYRLVGIEEGRVLDEWMENMHEEDAEWVKKSWAEHLESREPFTARFRWKWGDYCLVQAVLNNANKQHATGWIASVTNVTAQARAEEAILNVSKEREARAKAEAEEAEERRKVAVEEKRQQELLIDVTSHEIRNPISAILQNSDFTRSSLQKLRDTLLTLQQRNALPSELADSTLNDLDEDIEALDAITECGMAQERIANDILGLAQIQLSKYNITPVEFDLATSLRNICRMFKTECRMKDIELKLVIGSSLARLGPRARVFADPARLTQVLVNLLSNAIRFTAKSPTRVVTLAVEVSAQPPDRDAPLIPPHEVEYHIEQRKPVYLFFSVEDSGPGMTEEETSRLFAKFMQASPFTHTTWGGSGLGLWIARNLCELQAGRIEVASTVGKGSIFRCFITARSVDTGPHATDRPLAVVEGITGPNAERGAAPRVFLSTTGKEEQPLKGVVVLCCEDNQINRTVLRKQLQKEGCEVLLACDGQEGLDILNERPAGQVDCILMDIEMPVMDGLAATKAIRQAEREGKRAGHQRIVGLTGNARNAQRQAAIDAGMDTVITKPYKVPDLVAKIRADVPDSEPGSPMRASSPGNAVNGTYTAEDRKGETVTHLSSGADVEVISPGSPTSSPSYEDSPKPNESGSRSSDEGATESMLHHGSGMVFPASHPEGRSLEREV
ncbi:Two-component-like hybrid sensor histidine kinase 2 [Rhodotorula toruloides ATCC 204091]|uniref:histidine kinase n=1 Tax=Rhodotorula toruloides TaxID=5286 RepID=A0A0K3C6R1_RHOTO|nr:Two-component-like hybrid sensor histidine kinase 2 [Rhodotorula toruloides ATCC 204091]KAK4334162.1 Two-component-like hybrid sensor histidine kinase 2 [Rhodotorula toruloides]PRQ77316.1 Two-component-like hybrid sensor histidine kinase 2 [Rhodotorula toruloides]